MKTIFQCAVMVGLFSSACAMAGSINERQSNQQDRIQQGVYSGELTQKEANMLGRQQVKTHRIRILATVFFSATFKPQSFLS